jgi:hypothetical protein
MVMDGHGFAWFEFKIEGDLQLESKVENGGGGASVRVAGKFETKNLQSQKAKNKTNK